MELLGVEGHVDSRLSLFGDWFKCRGKIIAQSAPNIP
jgi:hypothetical protein